MAPHATESPFSGQDISTTTFKPKAVLSPPSDPSGVTGQLCNWVHSISLDSVPDEVLERAKHLILDGLACAVVGAHVPWSEETVRAVESFEADGESTVIGWDKVRDLM